MSNPVNSVGQTRLQEIDGHQQVVGYLKNGVSADEKQRFLVLIEGYRQELVPLIVRLTLLQHHLWRHSVSDWV